MKGNQSVELFHVVGGGGCRVLTSVLAFRDLTVHAHLFGNDLKGQIMIILRIYLLKLLHGTLLASLAMVWNDLQVKKSM